MSSPHEHKNEAAAALPAASMDLFHGQVLALVEADRYLYKFEMGGTALVPTGVSLCF